MTVSVWLSRLNMKWPSTAVLISRKRCLFPAVSVVCEYLPPSPDVETMVPLSKPVSAVGASELECIALAAVVMTVG